MVLVTEETKEILENIKGNVLLNVYIEFFNHFAITKLTFTQ